MPKPEPFGYFRAEPFGWTDCAETDEGAMALYDQAAVDALERERDELALIIATDTGTEGAVANLQGRVEELEDKVESLEREIDAYESWKDIIKQRDALLADNARLWEAIDRQPYTMDREVCEALAATPAQSLARIRNQVREECAVVGDDYATYSGAHVARVLRATKEPE